jgi:aspartate aminotransferase
MVMLARSGALDPVCLSVFDRIEQAAKASNRPVIPLHQGRTAFSPPVELREWGAGEFDQLSHNDGPSHGAAMLLDALQVSLEERLGQHIDRERIQVTNGITHALSIVFHLVLSPGDEVLMLSPRWLFAEGLVRAAHGVPVEVPCFPLAGETAPSDLAAHIACHATPRTRAVYFNSPNNPTGCALSAAQVDQVVRTASKLGLWVVADNAYEQYDYSNDGFVDPVRLPGAADHTFAAYSFSKSFGLTGYRIGYLLAPPAVAEHARRHALYSIYSVATCAQFIALQALKCGKDVIDRNRRFVKEALDLTVAKLDVPATQPDGAFYALLDLSQWPHGVDHFIDCCIAAGVSLAPGRAFGAGCDNHARLCFSGVQLDELAEGIQIINEVFDRREDRRPS